MPDSPEWGPEVIREILRSLDAAGVRFLVGQDNNRAAYTFEEMEALVEAGISPEHVLKAATIHAAMWMGMEDELGSLAPGRRADILLVRGNPLENMTALRTPWMVLREGEVVFPGE
jgi:imidazolonepropionase-like amidohydrolase